MTVTPIKTRSLRQPSPRLNRLKEILGPDWQSAYSFMLPAVLLLGGVIALPFFLAFLLSFTNTHTFGEIGPFVNIQNYVKIWQDHYFRTSVWITIRYTFWTVLFKAVIGLGAALLLNRLKRSASLITSFFLLPWAMPEVVRATTWKGLLNPFYGGVNRLLVDLNLLERAIPFFGDPDTALASVVLVNVWAGVPFMAIVFLAGLKAIDLELYEAAAIDGAGIWRQFLHITLPGLRYVIIVATLLATMWSFNEYAPISIMTRGGPVGTTLVYTIRVVEAANHFRFGVGVAMGMTLFPLLGLFILLLSRYMLAGQAQAEPGPSQPGQATATIAYYLAWPWLRLLKLWQHLFWTLNDSLERLGEKAGAGLGWSHRLAKPVARSGAAIALSLLLLFELLPFYWVIVTSFKTTLQLTTWSSILWPRPWTLEQYYLLFGPERNFVLWYGKTLLVSLISPLIATFVGAFGAYGLARLRWRGRSTFSSFVLVTYLTPGVLLVIPLLLIFQGLGLRNSLWSLILSYPSFTLPFALWLMMGYYAAIPEELEAAGLIDGCTRFQLFYRIVLPLTKPALVATFLFGMIHAWGEFLFASLFLHGQMNITLPVGLAFMVLTEVAPWGEVTAASLLMSLPVLIFYLMAQNFMVEGLAAGAIRGRG